MAALMSSPSSYSRSTDEHNDFLIAAVIAGIVIRTEMLMNSHELKIKLLGISIS